MFNAGFYPTPSPVITKMLSKITNKDAKYFLEPSAGKGNLAERMRGEKDYHFGGHSHKVDCIESEPELVSILQAKGFPVVGYDWLDFNGVCYYDAIVMNPPFANGAEHLLRAWDFMHDGEIVCLLNAETLLNPHTAERLRLAQLVLQHGTVESLGDCFRQAERSTNVDVALVYLKKESKDDTIEMWANVSGERDPESAAAADDVFLAIKDDLGNMEHYYNKANEHMLEAIHHIRKSALYLNANNIQPRKDEYEKMLPMALGNINTARAEFSRRHRRDAWTQVFQRMQFREWLDKKQTDQFLRDIEKESNVPFTADNIKGTLENVMLNRGKLFDQSVANVFDALTSYDKANTVHSEGWVTNNNYKVNQKLIFPYGCRYCNIMHYFSTRYDGPIDIYNDLDRILCVLDGKKFKDIVKIDRAMQDQFDTIRRKALIARDTTCESEYFEIRFFKKGTVHLKWKRKDLLEAFNIKAAAGKMWLGQNSKGATNANS